MSDDATIKLVARWRAGDQQAADELFRRYADQLIALARSRLSARLAHRLDAEDVVQSAYRSFFSGAREGRFEVQRGGDIWRLLVGITLNKLHLQVRRNQAGKRAIDRERTMQGDMDTDGFPTHLLDRAPSPIEAVALAEEVEQIMRGLDPLERRLLELRLQGYNLDEIAAETQYSYRTVRRVLKRVKEHVEQRHPDSGKP
jgi:RNA polymerase sigma-70 factor (ECF subfamily)